MAATLTSCSGILSLLEEKEDDLQGYALRKLNVLVDEHWPEIASAIDLIELLGDTEEPGPHQKLASFVASKVYYHLEETADAVRCALQAGDLFDISEGSEYTETMVARCIDDYTQILQRAYDKQKFEEGEEGEEGKSVEQEVEVDKRLADIVSRMFDRCIEDGRFKQAIGLAIESRSLRFLDLVVQRARGPQHELLAHTLHLALTVVSSKRFRHQIMRRLVALYQAQDVPDYISLCHCLHWLGEPQEVADILLALICSGSTDELGPKSGPLMAFQVGFELHAIQNGPFLQEVIDCLPDTEVDEKDDEADPNDMDFLLARLEKILSGETPISLYLHFLYQDNHTDLNILRKLKNSCDPRSGMCHQALVTAHSLMQAGTTVDRFVRSNQRWFGFAQDWAQFAAIASFGVVHKGHHAKSMKVLSSYLPPVTGSDSGSSSSSSSGGGGGNVYSQGGALYALGLIHAASGDKEKISYLSNAVMAASDNEIVLHGACLGLGLVAMSSCDTAMIEHLTSIVYSESTVGGEAAAVSLGLMQLGSGDSGEWVDDLLTFASETKREKVIRGIAVCMGLLCYGREEGAERLIRRLCGDKDAALRCGGVYGVALAYAGTANNGAIRRCLHIAVSDTSSDVRRSAVAALGFVLLNQPEKVPTIVRLLSGSYNPHVRYGVAQALGIACAGTGMPAAIELLNGLIKDKVDFVRQGAFIAMGMVMIQHNQTSLGAVADLRAAIWKSLDKLGDSVTKFGSIIAAGILDAGGRNVTIALRSPAGHKRQAAIVGMFMFQQYWHWYSYLHFLSLVFQPTAVIGLNQRLQMPRAFTYKSNAPPSLYAYPEPIKLETETKAKDVKDAVLSVAKRKDNLKKKGQKGKKDGESKEAEAQGKKKGGESKKKKKDKKKGDATQEAEEEEEEEPEPQFSVLRNPARVTWKQQSVLSANPGQRYVPIKDKLAGFVMLHDTRPQEDEDIRVKEEIEVLEAGIHPDEPDAPKPFEFDRD